jgi:carbon-monoxide dehydrogenase small subunit
MIMSAKVLLEENPDPSEAEIREGIAGNFCRCTGYTKIIESISAAAEAMKGEKS